MNRTSATTLLVTLAVLAAGCAAPPAAPAPDTQVLHDAEQVVLRDCMAKAGFRYELTPPPSVPDQREFPYVIDDVGWARKHGYGSDIQRRLDAIGADDPNQRYFQSLPADRRPAALAAANGTKPTGLTATDPDGITMSRSDQGCHAEVYRELYGDAQSWFQAATTVNALQGVKVERVTADPKFAAALGPWSQCMHTAGYDYKSPTALRAALPDPQHPLPFADEQRMAVSEAKCAVDTKLAATAKELDAHYDAALHDEYRAALDTQRRLQQAALPHARDLVHQNRPGS